MTHHDECQNGCCISPRCRWDSETPSERRLTVILANHGRAIDVGIPSDNGMEWQADSACRDEDPEVFFGRPKIAKSICARCPVIEQCAAHIQSLPTSTIGVWAGLTDEDRRVARKAGYNLVDLVIKKRRAQPALPTKTKPLTNREAQIENRRAMQQVRRVKAVATVKPNTKTALAEVPKQWADASVRRQQQVAKEQRERRKDGLLTREEYAETLNMSLRDFELFIQQSAVEFPAPIRIIGRPLRGGYDPAALDEWLDTITDPRRAA